MQDIDVKIELIFRSIVLQYNESRPEIFDSYIIKNFIYSSSSNLDVLFFTKQTDKSNTNLQSLATKESSKSNGHLTLLHKIHFFMREA